MLSEVRNKWIKSVEVQRPFSSMEAITLSRALLAISSKVSCWLPIWHIISPLSTTKHTCIFDYYINYEARIRYQNQQGWNLRTNALNRTPSKKKTRTNQLHISSQHMRPAHTSKSKITTFNLISIIRFQNCWNSLKKPSKAGTSIVIL